MMADRRLLAVFAHPDDETFLAGPALASYHVRGVTVHLCCATPAVPADPQSNAAQRRASLACAVGVLGIHQVHHLDLSEADVDRAAVEDLAERVQTVIRAVRPQVVLTDAAYGSYGHPHHILMHRATVAAIETLLDTEAQPRLYALAFPLPLVRLNARLLRLFGVRTEALGGRLDLNLPAILREDHPITARVDVMGFVVARRRAAACYPREIAVAPLPLKLFERAPLWAQQVLFGQARFTRIIPAWKPGEAVETDLFTHSEPRA